MRTADNRFMVLAITLRAIRTQIGVNVERAHEPGFSSGLECLKAAEEEIETIAREGPTDGEMLDWVVENLIEKRSVIGGGVAVHWVDADGEGQWTKGRDTRHAISRAMIEAKASEART